MPDVAQSSPYVRLGDSLPRTKYDSNICSNDMVRDPVNALKVEAGEDGRLTFCNARCLTVWALRTATHSKLPIDQRDRRYTIHMPAKKIVCYDIFELAHVSVSLALGEHQLVDRDVERSLAFEYANSVISTHCVSVQRAGGLEDGWYDLKTSEIDITEEVEYLEARHLIKRHPEHPHWIVLCDEGEPLR